MNKNHCQRCGGFIGEPNVAYGYAGKWCHCPTPQTNMTDIQTVQIAPTTRWIDTDLIDEDIKELFRGQGSYMHNDPLIAQHIKLLRQTLQVNTDDHA